MAEEKNEAQLKAEKKKIQDEKKKLKNDQKAHQKEAKKRAKELADQEAELEDQSKSGGFSVFMVTLFIILIWLVILGIIIKLDVGGIGSNVMAPLLKNVPVLNKILPADSITETDDLEAYYGYTSLSDAVDQIKALEMELTNARNANTTNISEIERLKAEVERLQTFEQQQVEFARIKTEFYESVIYAENGPGPDAFIQYFESIDKATADVRAGKTGPIPRELQNVHADGTGFEREQGYKYPHSYPGHWVKQQYLPDALRDAHYYTPGDNKTEQAAKAYWDAIKGGK